MKSKFLLLSFLLFVSAHKLFAQQQTKPILSNGCSFIHSLVCDDSSPYLVLVRTSSETADINGHSYFRFNLYKFPFGNDIISSFYYREADGKVYRYDEKSEKDILILDFTLKKGDKFVNSEGREYVVEEVADTSIIRTYDGKDMGSFKKLELVGVDDKKLSDTWIEGLGSVHRGLLSDDAIKDLQFDGKTFVSVESMLNAITASQDIYNNIDTNSLKAKGTRNALIMNDTTSLVHIRSNTRDIGFEFVGNSLHVVGTVSEYYDVNSLFFYLICQRNGNTIQLYDTGRYWGRHVFGVNPFNLNVYFPGFEAGEYTIKLVDWGYGGDAHLENTTIVCHGQVTDIHNISTPVFQQTTNAIYDLSGRRLHQLPERGIYIQNGKKYIVK